MPLQAQQRVNGCYLQRKQITLVDREKGTRGDMQQQQEVSYPAPNSVSGITCGANAAADDNAAAAAAAAAAAVCLRCAPQPTEMEERCAGTQGGRELSAGDASINTDAAHGGDDKAVAAATAAAAAAAAAASASVSSRSRALIVAEQVSNVLRRARSVVDRNHGLTKSPREQNDGSTRRTSASATTGYHDALAASTQSPPASLQEITPLAGHMPAAVTPVPARSQAESPSGHATSVTAPSSPSTAAPVKKQGGKLTRRLSADTLRPRDEHMQVLVGDVFDHLLYQEDIDGDKKITVTDLGPKSVVVHSNESFSTRTVRVSGSYAVSNLLQDLSVLRESGREYVVINKNALSQDPVLRLSRNIKGRFWTNLIRTIDRSGLEAICKDPKAFDCEPDENQSASSVSSASGSPSNVHRIYVPHSDTIAFEYFCSFANTLPTPLQVLKLPNEITPDYIRRLSAHPGILALALQKTRRKPHVEERCEIAHAVTKARELARVRGARRRLSSIAQNTELKAASQQKQQQVQQQQQQESKLQKSEKQQDNQGVFKQEQTRSDVDSGCVACPLGPGEPKCSEIEYTGIPFIVPGGRFNEMYGWDSYFEALGLLAGNASGDQPGYLTDIAKNMVDNFCYQLYYYGKVLNANRSYYLNRSQPPFLTDMARTVAAGMPPGSDRFEWLYRILLFAVREYYTLWTAAPRFDPKTGLSFYRTTGVGMPPETEPSHFVNVLEPFAKKLGLSVEEYSKRYRRGDITDEDLEKYFSHDRALRESGHDTTYRFENMCADLLTVDLNSLLYKYEVDIAQLIEELHKQVPGAPECCIPVGDEWTSASGMPAFENALPKKANFEQNVGPVDAALLPLHFYVPDVKHSTVPAPLCPSRVCNGDVLYVQTHKDETSEMLGSKLCPISSHWENADLWWQRARRRAKQMSRLMWDEKDGTYYDYNSPAGARQPYKAATALWTLWAGLATPRQARIMVRRLLPELEVKGGLVSCTESSRGPLSPTRPSRQWDFPYGWAPHQMLAWQGLYNYGFHATTRRLVYRWLYTIVKAYADFSGVVPEKFDVVNLEHRVNVEYGNVGADFEFVSKEGFGWMNASFLVGQRYLCPSLRRCLENVSDPEVTFLAIERRCAAARAEKAISATSEEDSTAVRRIIVPEPVYEDEEFLNAEEKEPSDVEPHEGNSVGC